MIAFFKTCSKDVRLPVQLQRAMAAEAEAAREARAKVIAAEGEQKASRALKEASMVIAQSPAALQLRYLQVSHLLTKIANCARHSMNCFTCINDLSWSTRNPNHSFEILGK